MKSPRILILLCVFASLIGLASTPGMLCAQTFTGPELLGRPTANSVTVNVVVNTALQAYFEYGTTAGGPYTQTSTIAYAADEPIKVVIGGLTANTKYYYRMVYSTNGTTWINRPEHTFWTQRAQGSTFSFTVTSDGHVGILIPPNDSQWQTTLTNVATDITSGLSDFHIELGDSVAMDDGSMTGGSVTSSTEARTVYLATRSATHFGRISHSPMFLLPGNHEQTEGWHLDDNGDTANSLPAWSINARKRYFLNPVPDAFYSGNTETYTYIDGDHMLENYYAWNWADALFIVLDPFWYTMAKARNEVTPGAPVTGTYGGGEDSEDGNGDRWNWTLGQKQYNWLRSILATSSAKYKFIFMHHMTGGTDDYIREGAYAAPYCEWGGYNEDGTTYAFDTRRSGWYKPIHQVLVENKVSAIFHGHDHQYAYETRNDIVYQSVPAAGFTGNGFNLYDESDSLTEKVLPSSGHLRVTVASAQTTVNYIRSGGGTTTYSYTIAPATATICLGDFDADGVVDGKDLASLIAYPMNVATFAQNFGKTTCP